MKHLDNKKSEHHTYMEEISLHGNVLGSYSRHDSDLRLGGGDHEAESGSFKLFSPDSTLSYLNLIQCPKLTFLGRRQLATIYKNVVTKKCQLSYFFAAKQK